MRKIKEDAQKFLLIDDDESFACFFSDALKHFGFTCEVIYDSMRIRKYDIHQYSHVVIDLLMPRCDGLKVLEHLKSVNFLGYVSVVSGQDRSVLESVQEICNLHHLTFHSALQKPFELEQLEKLTNPMPKILKNKTTFFQSKLHSKDGILLALRSALEQKAFDVHFQPKINLKDNTVIGFEALARWDHEGQSIPPNYFIPIAEQNGLSARLSDQIISKSLNDFSKFQALYDNPNLSINLSASELQERKLPDFLRTAIEKYSVSADNITLEITETVLLEKNMISLEVLTRFRLMGLKLSIDDFGTGFSSVNMLQNGPFTELKIDRSFISAINNNEQASIIVQSIIEMANRLKLNLVAEGIEEEATKVKLMDMSCNIGQGYLFGKPMPAQKIIESAPTRLNKFFN